MADSRTRDPSVTQLRCLTEEEKAAWRRERGVHVVFHRGHYWEEARLGFYSPVNVLARLTAEEASRPTPLCWGYRTLLREEDSAAANALIPTRLAKNLAGYDMASLPSKRRNSLRVCQRQVEIFEVLDPSASRLKEDAYEAYLSALKRTGYLQLSGVRRLLSVNEFAERLEQEVRPDIRVVLAGKVRGKIGGYLTGHAVDGTAYIDSVVLATEALPSNIGTGLVFEFMQICRRSNGIREVCYSLDAPEDAQLGRFKDGMGFPTIKLVARVGMPPGMPLFIRWRRPDAYYRLFGR